MTRMNFSLLGVTGHRFPFRLVRALESLEPPDVTRDFLEGDVVVKKEFLRHDAVVRIDDIAVGFLRN